MTNLKRWTTSFHSFLTPTMSISTHSFDVSIHWFRNGLRFHDNPSWKDACDRSKTIVPLYVIDPDAPFAQTAGRRAGLLRANFALEAIQEMDQKLQETKMGPSQMIVIRGSPEDVIPKVLDVIHPSALFYEKDPGTREMDRSVLRKIQETHKEVAIKSYDTHTLHPIEKYLAKCKGGTCPSTYTGFTKIFTSFKVPAQVETVSKVPPLPDEALLRLTNVFGDCMGIPSLQDLGYENVPEGLQNRTKGGIDFVGGEDAGVALLDQMMKRAKWVATFEKPKTSPNALQVDTTGLSPYIKHGCVSPRRFYHELSKVYAKFSPNVLSKPPVSLHGQLMWRDYNYLMGASTPNFDRMEGNPIARQIPWDNNEELLDAWKNSQTGYPFVDAIMTQLRETGWIHHLARHMVACFLTRGDLWQSWEKGAEVFEHYLIDADWSINNFNWQWLSCTAHFYQYFRCYSPIAFGKKTDPNGTYIKKWLPQFKNMPAKWIYEPWEAPLEVQRRCGVIIGKDYPYPIVDHKTISKENMQLMKEAYDAQKAGEPMPVVRRSVPTRRNDRERPSKKQKT